MRLFITRNKKGCFREEQDTQIKIYTIPMNNGVMEEPTVLTSEPLSRLDQHSDLNHPRPLPSSISGNDCEEEGGRGVSKLYSVQCPVFLTNLEGKVGKVDKVGKVGKEGRLRL